MFHVEHFFMVIHIGRFGVLEKWFLIRKMKAWPLIVGVGLILAGKFAAKASSVAKYKVRILGWPTIDLSGGLLGMANVGLTLGIDNPTNEKLTVQSVRGSVSSAGRHLGDFKTDFVQPVSIMPRTTTPVKVNVSVQLLSAAITTLTALLNKKSGSEIRVVGEVRLYGFTIPFDEQIRI